MPRANLEQLTARWSTQHAKDVVLVMIRRDLKQNDGQGLGSVLRSFKFPHAGEVPRHKDLRCISLEGEELPEANLSQVDLSWSTLAESDLRGANLAGAKLSRACLAGANLAGANLAGADCRRCDFTRANLADVDFSGASLDGAVFEEAYTARGVFKNAVATRLNLRGANLDQAVFSGSDLSRSNLSYGGLDKVAAPPAASDDLVYDLSREDFETQVGLKSEPARASKRLRALRPQLRENAREDRGARGKKRPPPTTVLPRDDEPTPEPLPRTPPATQVLVSVGDAAQDLETRVLRQPEVPPELDVPDETPTAVLRNPSRGGPPVLAPRPTGKFRTPTEPPAVAADPLQRVRTRTRRAPRPPLPVRPPRPATQTTPRPAKAPGTSPLGRAGAKAPGTSPLGRPPTRTVARPAPPTPEPTPPEPPTLAPVAEDGAAPHPEWAAAIGELMRLKPSVTKIAIELGDSSRLLYDGTSG